MPLSRINSASIANSAVAAADIADGTITAAKIVSIANTQITGNIVSSQITSVGGSQITANTIANSAFQTGSVENYLNAQSMNLGMRNRIINGNMAINQRGTTSGVTSGYFVDRWTLSGCSTSSTLTSSLPTGFNSGISISATSGNPIAIQKIEAANCSDLSGRNVTLSFYAKNISNATTLYASLAYATVSDNFGSTTTISEQNLGTLTTGWVRYTYTWTNLPSGALNGLALNLLCAGTGTFSMGITGVQLEVGNAPTPFEFRQYGTELRLCQRYFQKTNPDNVTLRQGGLSGVAYSGTNATFSYNFPVQMRSAPSATRGGTNNDFYVAGINTNISGTFDTALSSVGSFWAETTNLSPSAANGYLINYNGQLSLSAEL